MVRKLMHLAFLFLNFFKFYLKNKKNIQNSEFVFFFPSYHTGGAEKVHLDVVKFLSTYKDIAIFFTNSANNKQFLQAFQEKAVCFEVSEYLENNLRIRGMFEFFILLIFENSQKIELVFGANSAFFYDILPKIKKDIKKIDLIHAFSSPDYGFELYSLPIVPLLDNRITISDKTMRDFNSLYSSNGLLDYFERVRRVHNLCDFEPISVNEIGKKFDNRKVLNVAWIGRNSEEKRLQLFIDLAENSLRSNLNIQYNIVTDFLEEVHKKSNITYCGRIENSQEMKEFLLKQQVLIITSYREGLPLVFMEAISQGVVVISTMVGALPDFIKNGDNGFLIEEEDLICDLTNKVSLLSYNIDSLTPIAIEALMLFKKEFSQDEFRKKYYELFIEK